MELAWECDGELIVKAFISQCFCNSYTNRGVGRSKEDVDRFVDRIQESEVVTESFRKRGDVKILRLIL